MQRFADLLHALSFQPARLAKLRLLESYFRTAPDPDRGWALAALTAGLDLPAVKPALLRALGTERLDETLFGLSYDYVGDLAETLALVWDVAGGAKEGDDAPPPRLGDVVEALRSASRDQAGKLVVRWLDELDATGRWALLKLVTGAPRVGVSARLAKQAVAGLGAPTIDEIEEIWHGLDPPYADLFAWIEGEGARPDPGATPSYRPPMLANPLDEPELAAFDPAQWRAEWKWDGIRVQVVAVAGGRRLFSRGGEDIGAAFPEVLAAMNFDAVLDGELLVGRDDGSGVRAAAPFNDLQQRLNRKTPTAATIERHPAFVRLYDILIDAGEDVRGLPFDERRRRLEAWFAAHPSSLFDLSPLVAFSTWDELADIRARARDAGIEGLMLKRADSAYVAGRPKGPWFKWKRAPLTADCVLMYAQRGHGKRSSFYSDYTFGCWRDSAAAPGSRELTPVGKAYSGFTDAELAKLDKFVRDHTTQRFGPVRAVEPNLVLEIAFDGVQRSTRHKSGVAMRFPRVHRIRWDKPAVEADTVDMLMAMLPPST